jgi:hypothetical protein
MPRESGYCTKIVYGDDLARASNPLQVLAVPRQANLARLVAEQQVTALSLSHMLYGQATGCYVERVDGTRRTTLYFLTFRNGACTSEYVAPDVAGELRSLTIGRADLVSDEAARALPPHSAALNLATAPAKAA